jgi:CRP-like cAMP-binding protein
MPARNGFLSALSEPELALIGPQLTSFNLRLDDCLHRHGDRIEHVIFPHSGLVAMTTSSQEGSGAGVILAGCDGIIGGFAAVGLAGAGSDARVQIAGEASRLTAASFRYFLDQNPSVRRLAARFDSAMLAQAQQTALCNAIHPVEARICRWLLEIQDRIHSEKIPLTQSALAQMLGVRRTTVTLIIGRLEAAGVIEGRRGYVHIISHEELERHSCECFARVHGYVADLFAASSRTDSLMAAVPLVLSVPFPPQRVGPPDRYAL